MFLQALNKGVSQAFINACLGQKGKRDLPLTNDLDKVEKRAAKKLANRDIVFVLDSSGSISTDNFNKAKKAINVLVESFCPSKLGTCTPYLFTDVANLIQSCIMASVSVYS